MDLGQIAAALTIIAILAGFGTWLVKHHPLSWLQTHWPVSAKEHAEALRSIAELRVEIAAMHHVDGLLQERIGATELNLTKNVEQIYTRLNDLSELTTAMQVPQQLPYQERFFSDAERSPHEYVSRDVWEWVIPIAGRQPLPRGSGCAR